MVSFLKKLTCWIEAMRSSFNNWQYANSSNMQFCHIPYCMLKWLVVDDSESENSLTHRFLIKVSETTFGIAIIQCSIESPQYWESAKEPVVLFQTFRKISELLVLNYQKFYSFFKLVFQRDFSLDFEPPLLNSISDQYNCLSTAKLLV